MRRAPIAVLAAVAVAAVSLAACDDDPAPRSSATATPSGSARQLSPFTGRPYEPAPVLAVKVDNVAPARPQTGIAKADIVYVEPVEAGLSRILAVYSSSLPRTVGPVRSARASDLELLRQFGRPAFAYSGARTSVRPDIGRAPLYDVSPANAGHAYVRSAPHRAPHNLYARPDSLLTEAPRAAEPRDIGFRFGAAPAGGTPVDARTVTYPAFRMRFGWSAEREAWLVGMDNAAYGAAYGPRPTPSTVVVQYVDAEPRGPKDKFGNRSPYVESVGKGRAVVLRDGRAFEARWQRPFPDGGTTYTTAEGEPMTFDPGQVWVVFAPRG
ncbi:MAG: DUF3048 domain-containing protein [Streptosporangiales bacterium]|nr:DUF3048 domain-containing protein [Streptosporangiales bacterium]